MVGLEVLVTDQQGYMATFGFFVGFVGRIAIVFEKYL